MTHDRRTALEVHVESPYTMISSTQHIRYGETVLSYRPVLDQFNFGSFNRLKTIYKIRRNTWFFLGNDKESLNVYFPSTSSFTGTVRLFTLPFTARFEISTHTVQLELAFLLCDLTPRTLRFETRAHVHTGEVKGRVVT